MVVYHHSVLAFDPISCAVAFSALEHVCNSSRPHRAMHRARVWLLRAPSEVLVDAMLNEVSDHVLGAINAVDTRLVLIVSFIVFLRLTLQIAREARG
jgi:hypothetical protein